MAHFLIEGQTIGCLGKLPDYDNNLLQQVSVTQETAAAVAAANVNVSETVLTTLALMSATSLLLVSDSTALRNSLQVTRREKPSNDQNMLL